MTGSSGSMSFAPRRTPTPSPDSNRKSESTRSGRVSRTWRSASASSAASTTLWPCSSRAWRSIALSESLSSTMRLGALGPRGVGIPLLRQPARRHARLARFLFEIVDRLLLVLHLLLHTIELGERLLAIRLDQRALRRIVARSEVGPERIDLALQRVEIHLGVLEIRPGLGRPIATGLLVARLLLLRLVSRLLLGRLCGVPSRGRLIRAGGRNRYLGRLEILIGQNAGWFGDVLPARLLLASHVGQRLGAGAGGPAGHEQHGRGEADHAHLHLSDLSAEPARNFRPALITQKKTPGFRDSRDSKKTWIPEFRILPGAAARFSNPV